MAQSEPVQTKKGIWIEREAPLIYSTSLRELTDDVVGFIPFEHPYEPGYLGHIGFFGYR